MDKTEEKAIFDKAEEKAREERLFYDKLDLYEKIVGRSAAKYGAEGETGEGPKGTEGEEGAEGAAGPDGEGGPDGEEGPDGDEPVMLAGSPISSAETGRTVTARQSGNRQKRFSHFAVFISNTPDDS